MILSKSNLSGKDMHRSCKRKKSSQALASYSQDDEMSDERKKVSQQEGKTPGRRGEQIKQQEIDKEIVRRNRLQQKNKKDGN